jgi:hypothetical protein
MHLTSIFETPVVNARKHLSQYEKYFKTISYSVPSSADFQKGRQKPLRTVRTHEEFLTDMTTRYNHTVKQLFISAGTISGAPVEESPIFMSLLNEEVHDTTVTFAVYTD